MQKMYIKCLIIDNLNILKYINKDISIDIIPIKIKYKNNNNEYEGREQNTIIIYNKNIIKFLDGKNAKMFGLDFTYKIIPRSYSPYKMMSLYAINENNKSIIIPCLILLKYKDSHSLIKLFELLNILYKFNPKCVNTDFDFSQIKALKNCTLFTTKPTIVPCFFHYSQAIFRNLKN